MTDVVNPVAVLVALAVLAPGTASAQTTRLSPSSPGKGWNLDFSGSAGISPGIGAAATGLDLSGAVTLVRTTHPDELAHHCWGVTTLATTDWTRSTSGAASSHEVGVFAGPRWDYGDADGTGFVRVFAGARQLSEERNTTFAIGAGMGVEVLRVLLDVNWVMSPWNKHSPYRLTVSAGYMWSFRLRAGR